MDIHIESYSTNFALSLVLLRNRVSIVEFVNATMKSTMNPTNNDKDFLKVLLNSLLKTMKSAMNPRNKFKGKSLYHCFLLYGLIFKYLLF